MISYFYIMQDIINILLKIKHNNELNVNFLNEMINVKHEVSDMAKNIDLNVIDDIFFEFNNNINCENMQYQINKLKTQIEQINIQLFLLCDHTFIYDHIDVDLDKSKQICYCLKCEYNTNLYNI